MTRDRQIAVRERPTRDLVVLARDAADAIRDLPGLAPLADALDGTTAEVIIDLYRAADVTPV